MREQETIEVIADFQEALKKELEKKNKEPRKKDNQKEKAFWDHLQQ